MDKKEKKQKTKNFTQTIIDTLQENVSYSMIARTHKISVSNVIRCFDEVAKQIEISKDKDEIKHISIDELRFVKSKQANYQFIIIDTTTRKIQEILQDRKQSVIKEHLKNNYKNIQTVSQDLWKPYKTVAKSLYEEVEIIPDRFHVIRQFTWAFTRERIKLQKQEGIKTNRNWKILTKRQRNLDEKGKERLEELLKKHKQLEIIHTAKEKAYETFKRQSVEEYREKLEELKEYVKENNIQEFKKAIKTIQVWEQDIENMFKYDITNGVVERINRTIKQSKNIAYGYRNLERATKLVQYRVNKCTLKVS
ncbi:ISL3 family transposase [Peptoanaerobacter stomatis]|uniref:ISL3 family transposase n=1 Tax=Peptoanaerobacter stomatis TaxID=796937 RepID=UPI003FA00CDF